MAYIATGLFIGFSRLYFKFICRRFGQFQRSEWKTARTAVEVKTAARGVCQVEISKDSVLWKIKIYLYEMAFIV